MPIEQVLHALCFTFFPKLCNRAISHKIRVNVASAEDKLLLISTQTEMKESDLLLLFHCLIGHTYFRFG